jgi:zinc D-Ala-D-Ala carboxypeptidase
MPTTQLSPHFTLAEFTYSETAARQGIPNQPDAAAMENLYRTADVMEKVRTICGNLPVTITSGYRGPQLNKAIGGATNSAHMYGLGADFIVPSFGDPLAVCKAIEPHLQELGIDQLIWEYSDWTHLGLSSGAPRYQCLTIDNNGTRYGFA